MRSFSSLLSCVVGQSTMFIGAWLGERKTSGASRLRQKWLSLVLDLGCGLCTKPVVQLLEVQKYKVLLSTAYLSYGPGPLACFASPVCSMCPWTQNTSDPFWRLHLGSLVQVVLFLECCPLHFTSALFRRHKYHRQGIISPNNMSTAPWRRPVFGVGVPATFLGVGGGPGHCLRRCVCAHWRCPLPHDVRAHRVDHRCPFPTST